MHGDMLVAFLVVELKSHHHIDLLLPCFLLPYPFKPVQWSEVVDYWAQLAQHSNQDLSYKICQHR
jgi:hypothetical protein